MEDFSKRSGTEEHLTEKQSDLEIPIGTIKTSNELEIAKDSKSGYKETNQREAEEKTFWGKIISSFY